MSLPPEPLWVEADPVRLEQVLANLLTNAAKYTEPGGRIALEAVREADLLVVRVRDNGVGIAPEVLPRVFDLFVQADATADRSQGGLGIGLTLVRSLVEMHGGTVSASSAGPGLGSEFVVSLPWRRPGRGAGARADLTGDGRPGRSATEAGPRRGRLGGHGAEPGPAPQGLGARGALAHDGPAALEAAQAHGPEVVLLDLGLPGMDGYEVAVRSAGNGGGPRIVALTGYGQAEDRRRSQEAGFDHHLVKPVDPEALRKSLGE